MFDEFDEYQALKIAINSRVKAVFYPFEVDKLSSEHKSNRSISRFYTGYLKLQNWKWVFCIKDGEINFWL